MRPLILWLFMATTCWAVEPSEMLADTKLEATAQSLDDVIRCVKCRSESIASSNADWARDARLRVRELLSEGKSEEEVLEVFVRAYGEVVLMRPSKKGSNLALWLAAPALLLFALFISIRFMFSRKSVEKPLTKEEQVEIESVLASARRGGTGS
jgi:cytochrome c-type biogenesis protein CcmH